MTIEDIEDVEKELHRFIKRLAEAKIRLKKDTYAYYGCKETGALRRGALDLKNELTKLTK